ncbi:MAG TPA: type II secretion system protein GspL [Luteimonas sp.]|nr:type II secretion system protein GspL [Luteimonas sp.]
MSLLRIYGSLLDPPQRCQWALVSDGRDPVAGEGPLAQLPRRAERVQLVIPAAQVLITRARLPHAARRHAGSVLAFAVEEQTAGEPDANQVSWIGAVGDNAVLAVVDKSGLTRWRDALDAAGVRGYEVHCETLLLPWATGEWSLAWNGREGFVRTGEFEGAATDCGDREAPPLSLRLMLEEAQAHDAGPTSIALYATVPDAAPAIEAWTRELGIAVRLAGPWDWRTVPPGAGISLAQERQRWRPFTGAAARLRPAGWILGAALAIHAAALVIDWTSLANEQRALRQQMESRFRAVFPDAVAVVDPALQMRRKLAEARHAGGQSDSGDFLPMIAQVAAAVKELPAGAVRAVSYESGRMTLELSAVDEASVRRIVARLLQSGLSVDTSPASTRAAGAPVVLTVWAS